MPDTFFFDRQCRITNPQNARYRVEIVAGGEARFFDQGKTSGPFYSELIQDIHHKGFLGMYLPVLLKSLTESPS